MGISASVHVEQVTEGHLLSSLQDPSRALLPQEEWPAKAGTAAVWASQEVWNALAAELYRRRIVAPISLSEVVHIGGKPVLNGLFGVAKGKPKPGRTRQQRL